MNKKKKILIAAIGVVLFAVAAWAMLPSAADRQMAKVVEMQEQLFKPDAKGPPSREAFEEFRKEAEKLSPEQRGQMMRDNPPPFMRQMQQNVVAYFDLPEDQRKAHLDKTIDEMEKRRKEWENRRQERGNQAGGGPGPGGGRGGPGGFGRGGMDPARRAEFQKRMLDNTTPQQRAMFSEYFDQMQQRRQERGLPQMPGRF